MLRTATAGLAARLDFTLDDIEDLRIAVDEACAMVLPRRCPGGDLHVRVLPRLRRAHRLGDRGRARRRSSRAGTGSPGQVLTALTTSLAADVEGGPARRSPCLAAAVTWSDDDRGHPLDDRPSAAPATSGDPRDQRRAVHRVHRPGDLRGERVRSAATSWCALHLPLVEHFARRFRNRGEPFDDLLQVGTIGLIKVVDRFDLDRGVEFSTYATPTIIGEIKRHFRDKGWAIRVPAPAAGAADRDHRGDRGAAAGARPLAHAARAAERASASSEEEVVEGWSRPTPTPRCPSTRRTPPTRRSIRMIDALGEDDEALEHVENREIDQAAAGPARPAREADPDAAVLPRA